MTVNSLPLQIHMCDDWLANLQGCGGSVIVVVAVGGGCIAVAGQVLQLQDGSVVLGLQVQN